MNMRATRPVVVKQMWDPNSNHRIYTHTTPTILQLFILFGLLLILPFQMWVHKKTTTQRSTTTKSRKLTNDQNGRKRISKNKRRTQVTQDEELCDTDTEQQNSEH